MEQLTIPVEVNVVLTLQQDTPLGSNNVYRTEYRYCSFPLGIYGEWCTTKKRALNSVQVQLKGLTLGGSD